jgi:predicted dehydrogenase
MTKVRLGIIGLGNIGSHHATYLQAGKVPEAELTAVAAATPSKLGSYSALKTFTGGEELIRSGLVDAVIVATPHPQHVALGIAALRQGLHVLMEKPLAAHKADALKLLEAHRNLPELVFAGMFQFRVEPRYLKIRSLIQNGDLGRIVRVNWIMTDWYRTEAYYSSGGWRATWKGEGGGVLLNQCVHNLDMLQWLLGMPARVRGFCQLGRFHDIEVEDNVSAYFEYANGATGTLVSSTGEAPGTNRLEIAGTLGRLVLEQDTLRLARNESDMLAFSKSASLGFAKPEVSSVEIPLESAVDPHALVTRNFVKAITAGEPLIAPGGEGIHSVELANAILYSSLQGGTVELPMDATACEQKLNELIRTSNIAQRAVTGSATDFSKSFRR